jgi:hypothetical protein
MIALTAAMIRFGLFLLIPVYMVLAVPANAAAGAAAPEPSDFVLFIIGLLGVILGREVAMRYKRRDKERDNKH